MHLNVPDHWFRLIVEDSPTAKVLSDREGRILLVNRTAEALFGYGRPELVGGSIEQLIPELLRGSHPEAARAFQIAPRSAAIEPPGALLGRHRDGRMFPVQIGLNLITSSTGTFVLSAILDVTERTAEQELLAAHALLEQRVEERTAQLKRSNEDLEDFAQSVSHDLREPLRGIHGSARFLLEDYGSQLDAEGRARLRALGALAQRLDHMIDSLLHFSQIGQVDLVAGELDLDAVLGEVLDTLRIRLDEQGVEVRVHGPLPTLNCDGARVGEIFRNLITNAAKYNESERKWIEIGVEPTEPPTFYVRDNGIGMKKEHVGKIFGLFQRLHRRDTYDGTGVGLAIVKKIVDRHEGRIWVESEPGKGTTFYFTLGSPEPETCASLAALHGA